MLHATCRFCAVVLFASVLQYAAAQTSSGPARMQVIVIDAGAPAHALPHFWETMFGSGRAILALRESYLHDLREVKQITGFEYVRFHAIFHDEVGIYDEGAATGSVSFAINSRKAAIILAIIPSSKAHRSACLDEKCR